MISKFQNLCDQNYLIFFSFNSTLLSANNIIALQIQSRERIRVRVCIRKEITIV